jgi:hypothetical protein
MQAENRREARVVLALFVPRLRDCGRQRSEEVEHVSQSGADAARRGASTSSQFFLPGVFALSTSVLEELIVPIRSTFL